MTTQHTTPADIPFPPNPNPKRPRLIAPPGSWDTHFHLFGPPHRFPYDEGRRYSPPTAPLEHWLSVFSAIGIERGLIVTPSVHDRDPAVTLDAIQRADGRLRGMVRADSRMTKDDARRLHAGGIRGIRFPFSKVTRRKFDERELHANLSIIDSLPWVTEFQIDGQGLLEHADLIGSIQRPTIIDHGAIADIDLEDGLDQPLLRTFLDLLAGPNIYLKLSGHERRLLEGRSYESIVALTRFLIEKAPDRMLWGSDWPHAYVFKANEMPDDGELLDHLLDFAPDEAVRKMILVDNPERLFGGPLGSA
jgi:predicted TIM-barrel fold metal-dependent hydrolase